jgi:protein farnesyltransferase subunit beta
MDGFGMEGLGFPTETSTEQWELELTARSIYSRAVSAGLADPADAASPGDWETSVAVLQREEHVAYLLKSLRRLSAGFVVLDASRCWLCYWIVHSLTLLGEALPADLADDVIEFLALCQCADGGFGGGPGQMAHLAPTYAAVCCLADIATDAAAKVVDRNTMRDFLRRCKDERSCGFRMHDGGETDVRGCYTALAVAHLCGIDDSYLRDGVPGFVSRCQTHEGGIAGEQGAEAHGGYAFCGLAAVTLCGKSLARDALDLNQLARWLTHRQGAVEGGFMGRTNKLVDGCYSFWQGGSFPLLGLLMREKEKEKGEQGEASANEGGAAETTRAKSGDPRKQNVSDARGAPACALFPAAVSRDSRDSTSLGLAFNSRALQGWLLLCCQLPNGGLQDKPGKGRDHYHTCYCLSGLAVAQHFGRDGTLGPSANVLEKINPVVNVVESAYVRWMSLVEKQTTQDAAE